MSPTPEEIRAEIERRKAANKLPTREEIATEVSRRDPSNGWAIAEQAGTGTSEGLASVLGFPVDAVASAINGGAELLGSDFRVNNPVGGSASFNALFEPTQADWEPRTGVQKFMRGAGREVGAAVVPGGMAVKYGARAMPVVATEAAAALGGQTAAQSAEALGAPVPVQEAARFAGNLAGGIPVANRMTAPPKVPTSDDLLRQGGRAIDDAVNSGRAVDPSVTANLAPRVRGVLQNEGLIGPSGRLSESYPKAKAVDTLMDDYAGHAMTPKQAQTLNRVASDAARAGGPEGHIGRMMRDEITNSVVKPHLPDLAEANKVYARGKRGQEVDLLIDRAGRQASRSGTGGNSVNAIRQRADALLRRIEDGKAQGYSPDDIALLRQIISPGRGEDMLRAGGFLAPSTGKLQSALAGMTAVGSATALPPTAAAAVIGGMGISEASKRIAEALAKGKAGRLSEQVRRGAPAPGPTRERAAIIAALLGGQAAQLPQPQ